MMEQPKSQKQNQQPQIDPIQQKKQKFSMQYQLFNVEINETIAMLINEIKVKNARILKLQAAKEVDVPLQKAAANFKADEKMK